MCNLRFRGSDIVVFVDHRCRDTSRKFITSVDDTSDTGVQLDTGVVDTSVVGVVDTGGIPKTVKLSQFLKIQIGVILVIIRRPREDD